MSNQGRGRGKPRGGNLELDTLIEWVLRVLMSYLAVPGPPNRSEEELRQLLRGMILPAVLLQG